MASPAAPAPTAAAPAPQAHGSNQIKIKPALDSMLGQILPVAVPFITKAAQEQIHAAIGKFSSQHPGKSIWETLGDFIAQQLKSGDLEKRIADRLHMTGFLAKVSNFSDELLSLVKTDPNLASLRDAAQKLDTQTLASTLKQGASVTAETVRTQLFEADTTGTIAGIVEANKVPIGNGDPAVKQHVLSAMSKMQPTDMAVKSPNAIFATNPEVLESVPAEHQPMVKAEINRLARVQTISPTPAAMEALMNSSLTTALAVSSIPRDKFVAANKKAMGATVARETHFRATRMTHRNQSVLIEALEKIKGVEPGAFNGAGDRDSRRLQLREVFFKRGQNPNLEDLFGPMDQPVIDEVSTVYSPASYFVDLLMYLRDNNLDKDKVATNTTQAGETDSLTGTPLEKLFRRRPDLGHIELTPENTNTTLPYIDLVNEVMESFIVNLPAYLDDVNRPRQTTIDAYNVGTQDSDELLSQPQNIKMEAYRQLAASVYPPTLPYHQPLDAQRIFLNYLGVSRTELVTNFRPSPPALSQKAIDAWKLKQKAQGADAASLTDEAAYEALVSLQRRALNAQQYCETLGLSQEEFLILTKGVFWEKEFFEMTECLPDLTPEDYQSRVGLRSTAACWGYNTQEDMLSDDPEKGVKFVKKQLLRRSGLSYTELVGVLQTTAINPNFPKGRNKTIFDSLRYSYRFLQELVDQKGPRQYDRLAQFLSSNTSILDLTQALQQLTSQASTGSQGQVSGDIHYASSDDEIKNWVIQNFGRIGKITVLESGQGPTLTVTGDIIAEKHDPSSNDLHDTDQMVDLMSDGRLMSPDGKLYRKAAIGYLASDGSITGRQGNRIGQVGLNSTVYYGNILNDQDINSVPAFQSITFSIDQIGQATSWSITGGKLVSTNDDHSKASAAQSSDDDENSKLWFLNELMGGSGNIDSLRLQHLDGSPLSMDEWDRLHRFVRIWRKLGWSISNTDRALSSGLTSYGSGVKSTIAAVDDTPDGEIDLDDFERPITFDDFVDPIPGQDQSDAEDVSPKFEITFEIIEQLAAVVQILETTDLTLEQLLTFWAPMTSNGPDSQYQRLFFKRNLRGKDPVFSADKNGDYFTGPATKISLHQGIISAAFSLKLTDLEFLIGVHSEAVTEQNLDPVPDILNMENLSKVYARSLLAQTLSVKVTELYKVIKGYGDPFTNPTECLKLLQNWGKMTKASFPWEELRYVADSVPTPQDPLALTLIDSLRVSKQLQDNVMNVKTTYPTVVQDDKATVDYVKSVTALLFDPTVVSGIVGLVSGTTVYSTIAPSISDAGFPTLVSACSTKSIKYNGPPKKGTQGASLQTCTLQVTGILSDDEIQKLTTVVDQTGLDLSKEADPILSLKSEWYNAVARIQRKAQEFFRDTLNPIFPKDVVNGEILLLAPDISPPPKQTKAPTPPPNTQPNPAKESSKTEPNAQGSAKLGRKSHPVASRSHIVANVAGKTQGATSAPVSHVPENIPDGIPATDSLVGPRKEDTPIPSNAAQEVDSATKAKFFLKYFMPYLQQKLAYNSVLETISSAAGFKDSSIAKTLLEQVITISAAPSDANPAPASSAPASSAPKGSAMEFLIESVNENIEMWQGYLDVELDKDYMFLVTGADKPKDFSLIPLKSAKEIDASIFTSSVSTFAPLLGADANTPVQPIPCSFQGSGTGEQTVWATDPIRLVPGMIYALQLPKTLQSNLEWQMVGSQPCKICPERWHAWWKGYLCPTTTDSYSFSMIGNSPNTPPAALVLLENIQLSLSTSVENDTQIFWTTADKAGQRLDASKPHSLQLSGISPDDLLWKTSTSLRSKIPPTCLLPDIAPAQIYSILTKMQKLALFLSHFNLSSQEILYIHSNKVAFSELPKVELDALSDEQRKNPPAPIDFDSIHTIDECVRMYDYTTFRDGLPRNTTNTLLDLFGWSTQNWEDDTSKIDASKIGASNDDKSKRDKSKRDQLAKHISLATSWDSCLVSIILSKANFTIGQAKEFRNARILMRIQKVLDLSKKLGVSIATLFAWASPLGTSSKDFNAYNIVSQNIQKTARSRFEPDAWTKAVRPLNNTLRENQKQALISYLLVQENFVEYNNIVDADSLFEFFLIDVQMTSLVETSRIIQAISTVQLFIQRCFLGLETNSGISTTTLSAERWNWMQKYRVWEANRQVYLYPENYIQPTLRDDKSEIFQQLESQLLQKNMSDDAVASAVRTFVQSLATVSNLEAIGLFVETDAGLTKGRVHIIARTRTTPFSYYYNWFLPTPGGDGDGYWNGLEAMNIDIPHVIDPETGSIGNYVSPVIFDGRLILFVAEFTQRTIPPDMNQLHPDDGKGNQVKDKDILKFDDMRSANPSQPVPQSVWETRMSWTEYRDGKWTTRQTCPSGYQDMARPRKNKPVDRVGDVSKYLLIPCRTFSDNSLSNPTGVTIYLASVDDPVELLAGWSFDGLQFSSVDAAKVQKEVADLAGTITTFQVLMGTAGIPAGLHSTQATNIVTTKDGTKRNKALNTSANAKPGASGKAAVTPNGIAAATTNPPVTHSEVVKPTLIAELPPPYIEDADLSSKVLPRADGTDATRFDPNNGPSIILWIREDVTKPTSSDISYQRFYHGFIHSLLKSSISGTDVSPIFKTIGKQGVDATGSVDALDADFTEAFGAWRLKLATKDSSAPVSAPRTPTPSRPPIHIPSSKARITPETIAAIRHRVGQSKALFTAQDNTVDPATLTPPPTPDPSEKQIPINFDERRTLYSLYNWELGLHAPMLLMDQLYKSQQYEKARNVAHYVFDPQSAAPGEDSRRYWRYPPFKAILATTIESLFLGLKSGKYDFQISQWRDHPFEPHLIARGRIQAYMRWIVKMYIQILIGWGDSLFRQNTLESIPQAIQMYVLASHIYGPRGQVVPLRHKVKPQTFLSLSQKFDAFSNAMVQLEEAFPFSNQTPLSVGKLPNDKDVYLPNLFGFAGTLYFAIPDNPEIRQLAGTIDDRLFKIRNSQDINGKFRTLPLLAPPIDPNLLVLAAAQGLSLNSILEDLQGPLPNCKLQSLLQKAFELVGETKGVGQSLISIREKKDGEQLSNIRQRQELSIQKTLMDMKTLALDEANRSLEVLQYSRVGAVSRLTYYFNLVGNDLSGIPAIDAEFEQLDAKIQAPITDGGLGLSQLESEQMAKTSKAQELTFTLNAVMAAIGVLHMLPNINFNGSPLGVGATTVFGPKNVARMTEITTKAIGLAAEALSNEASMAGTMGGHQRALQERILQANSAGYEISGIDKQITAAKIRVALASKEIDTQQQQIDNAQEVSDFLRDKYSSEQLYTWMDGVTKTLYYQTYTEAFALAKRVEKAFKYERPQKADATYIQPGYWDASRDGLLAGENLYLALKRLEADYLEERGYDYEITKSISLRMLDPVKLITLRETGSCEFSLDEILFDMDFPGHYLRRIRSVNLTIPCVVGPYTSINATLDMNSSEYRISPSAKAPYFKDPSDQDARFSATTAPITSIAVSSAQSDAGVFQVDFSDNSTRYQPFEGAGCISQWKLSLPPDIRQFDYNTIYDVVIQIRYTSLDGGGDLKDVATKEVSQYFDRAGDYAEKAGLVAIFDIKNEFASGWAAAATPPPDTRKQTTPPAPAPTPRARTATDPSPPAPKDGKPKDTTIDLSDLSARLPFFVRYRNTGGAAKVTKVHVLTDREFEKGQLVVNVGKLEKPDVAPTPIPIDTDAADVAAPMHHYTSDTNVDSGWADYANKWSLVFNKGKTDQEKVSLAGTTKFLMIVEYKVK